MSLAACGGDAAARRADAVTYDTLASGAVAVRSPAEGIWEDGEAWRLVEEVRIGAMDGGGPEMFGQVSGIAVDPLGRIWVAERQAGEIRIFDADGRHLRTVGRKGSGPGEYQAPDALFWAPDGTLRVMDQGQSRITVLDTTGALVGTQPRPGGFSQFPWPGGMDAGGRLYDVRMDVESRSMRLARLDAASGAETLLRLPASEPEVFEVTTEHGWTRATVPFSPRQVWTLAPDGTVWTGYGDDYRIAHTTFEGDTLRIVEREWQPVAVTGEEKDEAVEGLDGFVRAGGRVDRSRIPDEKPAFAALHADADGYLWVQPSREADAEGGVLDVFDPEGRYLGPVASGDVISLSRPFVVRGDRLYAVVYDEMDVPYVVRYRIEGKDASD